MKHIYVIYKSLLADVRSLYQVPLGTPAEDEYNWLLLGAPLLEKQILREYEHKVTIDVDIPKWVEPLVNLWRESHSPEVLSALRQVLLFCYKAELPYTHEQEDEEVQSWHQSNDSCSDWSLPNRDSDLMRILNYAKCIVADLVRDLDFRNIIPFHGPGAVTNSRSGRKGQFKDWYQAINAEYPYYDFMGLSKAYLNEEALTDPDFDFDKVITGKLISVPKTASGPRLICVHPEEAIWIQQGLRIVLERVCRRKLRYVRGPRGYINFDDQTVNGRKALESSQTREYATIDLKSASDRLSLELVRYLFPKEIMALLESCRAVSLKTPDGIHHPICSFAPMGNALTFPVQSIVYWALCIATMHVPLSSPMRIGEVNDTSMRVSGTCYVFGDDILVPSHSASLCCEVLERCGLKINRFKSFWNGHFRESCGVDAYQGIDVTPLRWRSGLDVVSLKDLMSASTLAQRLRMRGFHEASVALYSVMSRRLHDMGCRRLPMTNNPDHAGIAEYVPHSGSWQNASWHSHYQWFGVYVLKASPQVYTCAHGWNHVLSSLTSLERTGRSNDPSSAVTRRQRLKRVWVPQL